MAKELQVPVEHNEQFGSRFAVDLGLQYAMPFRNISVWGGIVQTLRSLLV